MDIKRYVGWLKSFWPSASEASTLERWRSVAGSCFGIFLTGAATHLLAQHYGFDIWFAAPLGASAVLVFAVPTSPLAQPWSVIGGNTISALIGIACAIMIPDMSLAAAVAVAAAIGVMFLFRCLHPPGGASALLAVLIQAQDFRFAFFPMMVNSILLVLAGVLFNNLAGRRYPYKPIQSMLSRFTGVVEDFRSALGTLKCHDIMSRGFYVVNPGTPAQVAWNIMQRHSINALSVVDESNRLVGIVTLADFVASFNNPTTTVARVMTKSVISAREGRYVVDLIPLFSKGGHHHLPVVNDENVLVGMITQADFVNALHRVVQPERVELLSAVEDSKAA